MTFPLTKWLNRFLGYFFSLYVGLCFVLVTGCERKRTAEQTLTVGETADATREEVLKTLGGNTITRQLHEMGSEFQQKALHDITRVPHYLQLSNHAAAAAILGVYMSDLGYLIDMDQRADGRRYFDGCLVLANHIGMGESFSHAIELRFSEIIEGNEDLKISLDRLFQKTNNTASGDDFKRMHAAALTGYYVEELYHLIMVFQSDEYSPELRMKAIQTLIHQRSGVDHLVGYFDHLQLKPKGIVLYQEFMKLQSAYLSLDTGRLLAENDPAVIMADSRFQEIVGALVRIRNSITE